MRTLCKPGPGYVPDESIMSTTAFAFGVFNSHLTQGNTNFNVLLSICTSQFNLAPEIGSADLCGGGWKALFAWRSLGFRDGPESLPVDL